MALNNRFSDWGYFGGWIANIGTAVAVDLAMGTRDTYIFYYYDIILTAFSTDVAVIDFENMALGVIGMVVRMVNYQAPEVQPANST